MRPCVLNSAGERDRRPLGQCRRAEIDLVVGQLSADAGIEGAVVLGLRERETRRGKCAREHTGERASSDDHGYSSLSKACSAYLIATRERAQAKETRPSIASIPRIRHNGRPSWKKKEDRPWRSQQVAAVSCKT